MRYLGTSHPVLPDHCYILLLSSSVEFCSARNLQQQLKGAILRLMTGVEALSIKSPAKYMSEITIVARVDCPERP